MQRFTLILSLALCAIPAAQAETCKRPPSEIADQFERWNDMLKTGNPDKVVSMYEDDAVLLPTMSNTPRLTRDAKRDYFVHFMEKRPVGSINSRAVRIGCNDAIASGLYTFKFEDGRSVAARYTYPMRGTARTGASPATIRRRCRSVERGWRPAARRLASPPPPWRFGMPPGHERGIGCPAQGAGTCMIRRPRRPARPGSASNDWPRRRSHRNAAGPGSRRRSGRRPSGPGCCRR